MNKNFKLINNLAGFSVFIISSIVYIMTVEPTASWWDCGEYIATAYKLQVGHPPGAPFFQLIGRFFSLFAFGDVTKVALMVNIMSALCSSATILFLFWTITMLALKFIKDEENITKGQIIAVVGSGLVGALAYTFSDSFWFSAVEGEVYAMSSFFTAIVFWAILKWDRVANQPHATRWLIFIAFLIGLSIGVHLLNLLAIPAIALIFYFNKYEKTTWKGILVTLAISFAVLAFILFVIVPYTVSLAGKYEIFAVNKLGLPFNVGTFFYLLVVAATLFWGMRFTYTDKHTKAEYAVGIVLLLLLSIFSTLTFIIFLLVIGAYYLYKKNAFRVSRNKVKVVANTAILSCIYILIGFSSFFILVIRANTNTPINENEPIDAVSLLAYLNREQYGSNPIIYGQYYNAPLDADNPGKDGDPVYVKDVESGKYIMTDERKNALPNFDKRFCTLFPRMHSSDESRQHPGTYKIWGKVKGTPIEYVNRNGEKEIIYKPTFVENLRFFFTYQAGHMYFRYFMWNFSGRQNNIQGFGEPQNGNWITGIPFIDNARLGDQTNLPDSMQNAAKNKFYMLPLIFGLVGMFYQIKQDKKNFLTVFLLFFMTGLAIILYLNSAPNEPRERDYAYAGSYYAFTIWIGMSVYALWDSLKKYRTPATATITTVALLLLVPVIMAKEGWDDHDRSGKYATRDFAANYLNSCEPNALLITHGDNDTFPLWYVQEVEEVRTDMRVVNYMLASSDWYTHQLMRKVYDSEKLPFYLGYEDYNKGVNDVLHYVSSGINERIDVRDLLEFIKNDPRAKIRQGNSTLTIFPVKKLRLYVDTAEIIANNYVNKKYWDRLVPYIDFDIKTNVMTKNDLMLLDILANNNFKRPVYFANPPQIRTFDFGDYCHLEGVVYRFLPIKADGPGYYKGLGDVHTDETYELLMNNSKWGNLNDPYVYIDRESARNTMMMKQDFFRLAMSLITENKPDSAVAVCDRVQELFPDSKFPYDLYMVQLVQVYYDAGEFEKGNTLINRLIDIQEQNVNYINAQKPNIRNAYKNELDEAYTLIGHSYQLSIKYNQPEITKKTEDILKQLGLI